MSLNIQLKQEFAGKVVGFNGKTAALGSRTDLDKFLLLAYLSNRAGYVAMFTNPPTKQELIDAGVTVPGAIPSVPVVAVPELTGMAWDLIRNPQVFLAPLTGDKTLAVVSVSGRIGSLLVTGGGHSITFTEGSFSQVVQTKTTGDTLICYANYANNREVWVDNTEGDGGAPGTATPPATYLYPPDAVSVGQPAWAAGTYPGQQAFYQDSAGELWSFLWNGTAWKNALATGQLLAKISKNGSVPPTQDGDQVRMDVNLIQDAPQGILSYNGAQGMFYDKAQDDARYAYLLNLINSINPQVETLPYLVDWLKIDENVTLVGGALDSWTGIKNAVTLTALSAVERPVYNTIGGPNNKPFATFAGGQKLTGTINFPVTQDLVMVAVCRSANAGNPSEVLAQLNYAIGEGPMIQRIQAGYKVSAQGDVYYSEAEFSAGYGTWNIVVAKAYYSLTNDEAKISVDGVNGTTTLDTDNTGSHAPVELTLGALKAALGYEFNGDLTDILLFSAPTTAQEDTLISNTLKTKFGL